MPKTSSNDRIDEVFKEIAEALNNPNLRERFLNGNKENEILSELVIYRLKESGKLANTKLQAVLETEGYKPCRFTHGLYKHETKNIAFSLGVNNFGMKYINKKDTDHLTLQKKYPIK